MKNKVVSFHICKSFVKVNGRQKARQMAGWFFQVALSVTAPFRVRACS